ncbi:Sucrase/ferredoxin-like-domain-containing protein [Tuber brumale]|nr:Sucrase/ferredoxin-like-domain-containing protein [Tuber brumale]
MRMHTRYALRQLSRGFHRTSVRFSTNRIPIPFGIPLQSSPYITEKCPPSCACSLENLPEDLDIDRATSLKGTMANYYRHLLVCTGRSDWASKIELDVAEPGGGLAGKIKELTAMRGGARRDLRDPFAPTLVTNSSFEREPGVGEGLGVASAYIFPSGLYLPKIPVGDESVVELVRGFLLPDGGDVGSTLESRKVLESVVLICSHNSRDTRCGLVAGPLKRQFERELAEKGILLGGHEGEKGGVGKVRVGFTSHLGGHKFAGNVVVYRPDGLGVWYGRVEPKHVTGIVAETILNGRVVGELCRGVVEKSGRVDV